MNNTCQHDGCSYLYEGTIECDYCDALLGTWSRRDEHGWPIVDKRTAAAPDWLGR